MPTFISKQGQWYPAKEEVALKNLSNKSFKYDGKTIQPGQPFIYNGPDREAIKMLHEEQEECLGTNFKHDPEFRQAYRNQGFETVEEYLKWIGYDEKKELAEFEKQASVVKAHDIPAKVNEIKVMGGGQDRSGNRDNDVIGGFGDQRVRSPRELAKR